MPHLSELQGQYANDGVTIIGVTKEDPSNSLEAVRKMTTEKGDTMAYTVAWDDEGKTYADYMTASGQRGIPTSFLVDREGTIAYIGHPMAMDLPMAMVVDGTWDVVEGPGMIEKIQEAKYAIQRGARSATKDSAGPLLKKVAAFLKEYPAMADSIELAHFQLLTADGQASEAAAIGWRIVNAAVTGKDFGSLNEIAWGIVDPLAKVESRDLGLALYAATVASNLSNNEDPAILDTLARVHFWMGGIDRAIELQEMAIALADSAMADDLEDALEEYLGAQ